MNLTRRTLSVIMALAVVFTSLVFVSVNASVNFPIHNTTVTFSGGNNQNCSQSKPSIEGQNKIAYALVEDNSLGATILVDAANLSKLVERSEYLGQYVSIDLYAEFKSSLDNTRVAASVNFGGGDVEPKAKNTNVAAPTDTHSVDFVNKKIVTLRLWIDEILTARTASMDKLTYVSVSITPAAKEEITGTFFFSAPYIESEDGEVVSTVDLTSIKTTTTKAAEKYDGQITVYNNGVSYVGAQQDAKAQWGKVNVCKVHYGDTVGFENKYMHVDGSGKQMQVLGCQVTGLPALREKALASGMSVCIDVYANEFTNGGHGNAKCDISLFFQGGSKVGSDDPEEKITIKSGIKQTIVFEPTSIGPSSGSFDITLQNYSYGDYANITDAKFIFSVPYLVDDEQVVITPSTTTTTTAFVPGPEVNAGNVKIYNNGVTITAAKGNKSTMTIGDHEGAEGKYVHVDGSVQQLQGDITLSGMDALIEKVRENDEPLLIDIYANDFSNGSHKPGYCDFKVCFSGGSWTGERDCTVKSGQRHTLKVDPAKAGTGAKFSIQIQNYSYGDGSSITNGRFILSVPYLASDISGAKEVKPSTTTTTTTTTATPMPDYDEGQIPLKVKNSLASFKSGGWGKPESGFSLFDKYLSLYNPVPYNSGLSDFVQFNVTVNNFDKVILDAIEKGKYIAFDVYGNFLKAGKTSADSVAKLAFNIGNIGNLGSSTGANTATIKDDIKYMISIKPNQVYTIEYDPVKLVEILDEKYNAEKPDTSVKDITKLTKNTSGGLVPSSSTTDAHVFTNPTANSYIEYTVSGLKAGTHLISATTKDYVDRGVYAVYVNGTRVEDLDTYYNGASTERSHDLGKFVMDADGDATVKIVYKSTGKNGGSKLHLESLKIVNEADLTSTAAPKLTTEELVKKIGNLSARFWGDSWNDKKIYGRFYVSVPYVVGDEEGEPISALTTKATTSSPTSQVEKFETISKVDLGYVDCKYVSVIDDAYEWGATNTELNKVYDKKVAQLTAKTKMKEVGARVFIDGSLNSMTFPEYIEYAKKAEALLAIDIYPEYSITGASSQKVDARITWVKADGTYTDYIWSSKLESATILPFNKYTYFIDPNEIPEDVSGYVVSIDCYTWDPSERWFTQGSNVYLTAPYLAKVGNPDVTMTSTTTTKPTTKVTQPKSTFEYPSNNLGGKTVLSVANTNVTPGGTVRVPIKITGNAGLYSAKFSLKFNAFDLSYVGCSNGSVFDSISVNEDDLKKGIVEIMLQSSSNTTANGVVAYIEFDAPTDEADYPISFAGSGYFPSNFFNYSGKNVPCSFKTGYVLVDSSGVRTRNDSDTSYIPYPTSNSGTTRFKIASVTENYVAGRKFKDFTVNISVSGNAGLYSSKFTVMYDNTKLKFLGSSAAKTIPAVFNLVDYNLDPIEHDPGILTYNFEPKDGSAAANSTKNGNIVTLKFRLLNYVPGTYNIAFGGENYEANKFLNFAGKKVPCSFTSGGITVKKNVLNTPVVSKIKLTKKKTAKVTWAPVSNATQYEVYRAINNSKSFLKVATLTGTAFTDATLKAGKKYTYKVVAKNTYEKSAASIEKSITPMNYKAKTVIKSVKSGKKLLKVTIKKKVKGATGYQICYSTSSSFSSNVKYVTTKKLKKSIKKLSSGSTYYVRVRAYNIVKGKKVFAKKWSKVKTQTAK